MPLHSSRVTSQVASLGTVGSVLGDMWWGPQEQEEDLCEDVGDGSVHRAARGGAEVRQGSVPVYVKATLLFVLPSP